MNATLRARRNDGFAGSTAARAAIENAGLQPSDIDLVLLATSTPNNTFPASAVAIQRELGITRGFAFDLQAVCSGFIYAITTADLYIRGGMARRAFWSSVRKPSRVSSTGPTAPPAFSFGDGAGAIVLEAAEGHGLTSDRGILAANLRSDGNHKEKLYVDGGPSTTQTVGHLRMEGPRGLQARRRHDYRCDRGFLRGKRASRPRISTGSCRIRPTSESSTLRQRSFTSLKRRSSSRLTGTETPLCRLGSTGPRHRCCRWSHQEGRSRSLKPWAADLPGARFLCAGKR